MDEKSKPAFDDSSEIIVRELRATFQAEAQELLAELEQALLELEKDPNDGQQIGRAFRAMHTIKGSGGACEFHEIAGFTHELETILDNVRSGKVTATKEIINLTLAARDQIEAMFNVYYRGGTADPARCTEILEEFRQLLPGMELKGGPAAEPAAKSIAQPEAGAPCLTYRIRFKPAADIALHGINPVHLLNELRELGACKIIAHTEAIPLLEDFDPQACYTSWDAILSTCRGLDAIQDVFIFVKDGSDVKIDIIDRDGFLDDEKTYKKVGEILLERGDLAIGDLQKVLESKKRVGEMLVETGVVPSAKVESALLEQQHVRELREQRQGADAAQSIRVATSKLDTMVNLVGELVTVQARLTQTAATSRIPALLAIAEEVERLTASLRDNAMNIRMLPIGTTFSRFKRIVRDLSVELGKEIEMTADGAETELDKTVIERLSDPLVHIIRNCIDHGIEQPAVRQAAGKPRQGTIHLSAVHSGAHVLIRVEDDGAGLDVSAIRAKALERGLIQPHDELSERQVMELILAPGFSTAKSVTGVSGRGVGMDVVKKAIDGLRGSIEVTSAPRRGTAILLKIPLTLAIIDGFLTRTAGEHFIFPLSLVEECVELSQGDAAGTHGRHLAHVRGSLVPYIRLRDYFGINGAPPRFQQIVITNVDGRRVGLVVDTVIGEHQTVIKSLGKYYQGVEGISGATIMGDGTVALILDIPKLVRQVEHEETKIARGGATV
ncbi:MAG TPA: chemotaxis protein CheA [Nitrospirota bacterium]|nr:chemotaxis protein CheA [Nitrospirota bacterium]